MMFCKNLKRTKEPLTISKVEHGDCNVEADGHSISGRGNLVAMEIIRAGYEAKRLELRQETGG